jgi:hypothetical protein
MYNKFYDIKYISKDRYYKANWLDGNISDYWDNGQRAEKIK